MKCVEVWLAAFDAWDHERKRLCEAPCSKFQKPPITQCGDCYIPVCIPFSSLASV